MKIYENKAFSNFTKVFICFKSVLINVNSVMQETGVWTLSSICLNSAPKVVIWKRFAALLNQFENLFCETLFVFVW